MKGYILLKKIFIISFFLCITFGSHAAENPNNFVFNRGNLAIVAPPYVNKDYYLIEFGFITEKVIQKWEYNYNAYVTAALFEDWKDRSDKNRAGALGFKAGVMLPTQPWVPLLLTLNAGYAKSVLNIQPLIGNESQNLEKRYMLLLEAGLLYRIDKYFIRFSYQKSNVKYFTRHTFLSLGVSY